MKRTKPMIPERAQNRLEALCARAEHCEWELRRKLASWKVSGEDAELILKDLRAKRFVDDARFARAFVRDKFTFGRWGRRKIEAALRLRRINSAVIAEALGEIDEGEYEAAIEALVGQKMATIADSDSYEGRTKVFRAVCSRGFEGEQVARIMRSKR